MPSRKNARLPDPLDAVSEAVAVLERPDAIERAYMARELVQCTLPHRDPGNVPVWTRRNGKLLLGLQPGPDLKTEKSLGYPYGTIPRLVLFWLISEAVRRKDRFPLAEARRIEISATSMNDFMRAVGLNPNTGGGKRGDAARLMDQAERLFACRIAFQDAEPVSRRDGAKPHRRLFMEIAPASELWWNHKRPEEGVLFGSWIELGEKFFAAVTSAPVPLDLRIVRTLKRSPLALDLYAWLCHRVYTCNKSGHVTLPISWEGLMEQMGTDYTNVDEFARKARAALSKIESLWRKTDTGKHGLLIDYVRGGIVLRPGSTLSVPQEPRQLELEDAITGR